MILNGINFLKNLFQHLIPSLHLNLNPLDIKILFHTSKKSLLELSKILKKPGKLPQQDPTPIRPILILLLDLKLFPYNLRDILL